jgi:DNA end-binding protein Ku
MWRGAVSFGLVSIAVRLYRATEEHDFAFHQVHRKDSGRIRYQRVCTVCGEEVPYEQIAKGYELDDGRMVVLDDEDFEKLPITTDRAIDVVEFVPAEQIDPIHFERSYYLEPDKAAVRPYVLLREALESSDKVAIVKIALRQRESLALLRAREDVLVLHSMLWPDEIRAADFDFLDQRTEVRRQELEMAKSLIDSMTGDFDPDEFTDSYRDAMQQLIEAKAEGAELPERPAPEKAEVVDLMTALQRSVEAAKESRGGGATKTQARKSTKSTAARSGTSKSAKSAPAKSAASKSTKTTKTAAKSTRSTSRTGTKKRSA